MIVTDTNVLLAAFRAEISAHSLARRWLEETMQQGQKICVPNCVQISFTRLATRRLGHLPAAPLALATQFLQAIAPFNDALPAELFTQALGLCARFGLVGDGSVDAWIAAHAIALNAPLVSFDRSFLKYSPSLQCVLLG
jgi:predicted nucleic acid-binding protein